MALMAAETFGVDYSQVRAIVAAEPRNRAAPSAEAHAGQIVMKISRFTPVS